MNGLDAEIVIVGAGFGGLGMAIQLKRHGFTSFVVLERAGDVGGTWRENDYPGCACDIPSILYSFSFAPNPSWSRIFPSQPEIWAYLRRCVDRFRIRPYLRFGAELEAATYDDAAAVWRVRVRGGEEFVCRVLISAMGPLNRPAIPALPGAERFTGPAFHSSRWDHGVDLRGKRVAVIGTGASAIQFVPRIAPQAATLTVYQRTPPWIVPRPDGPVGRARRLARRSVPFYRWSIRQAVYWMLEVRALGFTLQPKVLERAEALALRHLARQVPEPELRRALTPAYRMGCKRVLISNDYYPALRRENVELVTAGIREVRDAAIVDDDGVERPADVIVYGTGFRATEPLGGVRIRGRGGIDLHEAWQNGMEAYLGTNVAGFPNFFTIVGPNTGLGHNSMIFMMEAQFRYVLDALRLLRRRRARALDVRPEVQRRFNEGLQRRMAHTVWSTGCRSWYLDANGKNTTLWPGFTFAFRRLTRRVRAERYDLIGEGGR